MPKYKSLLSGVTRKAGSVKSKKAKKAGTTSGGVITAGTTSGGSKSAGIITAGVIVGGGEKYDENLNKFMDMIKKKPKLLLHTLEAMDPRAFHILKEVSNQRIGNKSIHYPQIAGALDKKHELYLPHQDIANNAKSMNHLIQAVHSELKNNPSGGGLFSSIWDGIKSGASYVGKIIKKIPKIADIKSDLNWIVDKVRPITDGIDKVTSVVAPEIPKLSPFVDQASSIINNPVVDTISGVQDDIDKAIG